MGKLSLIALKIEAKKTEIKPERTKPNRFALQMKITEYTKPPHRLKTTPILERIKRKELNQFLKMFIYSPFVQ